MSQWTDPAHWEALRSEAGCPICRDGGPWGAIATLDATRLVLPEPAPLRGYAVLFLRRHAVELHELEEAESAAFARDLRRVGHAIQALTGAVKLNWELHGNTIPHLHAHLFPRYRGDPFEGRPIDPKRLDPPVYAPGERDALAAALLEALARR